MSAPLMTPGSGGRKPKPVSYEPLSSIQAPKPKPEPQKPIVPLVVYTAFDAQTAEELRRRMEATIYPVDRPSPARKPETNDPPPYEHESTKRPVRKAANARRRRAAPRGSSAGRRLGTRGPARDLDISWSSETPFLSLDAAEMSDYFSALENDLVREVSISLQNQKFILFCLDDPLEYLKLFPTYTWDEESDAEAEKFIQWYVERFRPELERQRV